MHGLLLVVLLFLTQLLAAPVYYAKWSPTPTTENGETKYQGTINVNGVTVEVKFYASMPLQGISTGDGMDYWGPQLDFYGTSTPSPLPSAYLSSYVDDLPPASHIIRISHAQMNYFEFSQPVSGAVLAVARLSANSYLFDTDFTVYSSGDGTTNAPGYWGAGTLLREATPYGKYSLSGTGEPHGVIGIPGSHTSLFFNSMNEENWNGFNIGVFGLGSRSCPYSSVSVPAEATVECPIPALQCTKLLSALAQAPQSATACQVKNTGSVPFTLTAPGQKVYLTGRADGTYSPAFDELAVLKVSTPCNSVFGKNLIAWQSDCKDAAFNDTSVPTSQQANQVVDITSLFNGQVGEFTVSATVWNKYSPYSNSDVFVCTGSAMPKSINIVAELSEIEAASHPGAGAGLSIGEIVAVCVGAVVGTLLVIAGIGFVGYHVASRKSTKSELDEKFVLN
eukprot:TRINITY_DN19934_c0_g1_i2.p1 TRINITY_DN19934_c0_g1~~TRINITY_DN19934_c0_g1_i2.p1  ORF type:complete len:450 (+),score=39.67 TRINITY_DN19934_c0_g1_i2:40-1389(+)